MKRIRFLQVDEAAVLREKATERPFTGKWEKHWEKGLYVCRQCDAALFRSEQKFDAQCGWPSFDDAIPGAVREQTDADGRRTEIVCAQCGGHLGHVFRGEGFTTKNVRHCVNSLSLDFQPITVLEYQRIQSAYFAGGCFWGVEHLMQQLDGVLDVRSGYMGGRTEYPTYEEVCTKNTGHLEVVEIRYDPEKVDYEALTKRFLEIHDPEQANGQGPDIGPQYLSVIFYVNDLQQRIAKDLLQQLRTKGYDVATQLRPADVFWEAEDYHQNYYERKGQMPYCHSYTKRF